MKNIITSSNNEQIKEIRKLQNRKYRVKNKKFIIETRKLIEEAISSDFEIKKIFTREDVKLVFENTHIVDEKIFNELSYLQNPDGYLAIVKKKERLEISNKVLILDNLQDPGNVGTLIRSAEAFGFNTVISINSCDFYNEKVLRSTMGSVFRLNLLEKSFEEVQNLLDHQIFIADMDGIDYKHVQSPTKLAIVIGNEGNGISDQILKLAHTKVKIPMQGKVESLNAGVSGAILMSNL